MSDIKKKTAWLLGHLLGTKYRTNYSRRTGTYIWNSGTAMNDQSRARAVTGPVLCGLSPHTVVLVFDLLDEDGRANYKLAMLGSDAHLCLWKMWNKLHRVASGKTVGDDDVIQQAEYWLGQLLDTMDDYNVPLELG